MTPAHRTKPHSLAPFAPGALGDPVAKLTEWGPCKVGGASFCTHVLRDDDLARLSFRPTVGAIIFYAIFFLAGSGMVVLGVFTALTTDTAVPLVVLGLVGLLFGSIGAAMLWSGTQPIVFDRAQGRYWKGWSPTPPGVAAGVELTAIHALQIVSEYCGGKTRFYSYELNLVLKDGTRVNVVDHGDVARLRKEGSTVARFLGVPLWDPQP
jgi:hypothetical protein